MAPWGLVGMVGLVVLFEGFVGRRGMDFLDVDDWAYRRSAGEAASGARGARILCFGDSLVKLGIVPRAIEERTGLKTYNLAVSGSQAPASYYLLKRALASGAKPSALVVDFSPPLLRLGPRHNLLRWASLIGPIEAAELAFWARDPTLFAPMALAGVLPSIRGRESVRANILGALGGQGDSRHFTNVLLCRNWNRNDGAQLVAGTLSSGAMAPDQVERYQRGFYPKFACHRANAEGVRRFFALAAEHHLPVYWLLPPLLPELHDRLKASGYDSAHEAFVRSWQARFPNLIVLDGRARVSGPNAFFDPNHLSASAAYAFSLELGEALKPGQSGSNRWVSLPACLPGPLPGRLENLDQSRIALEAMAPVRR